MKHVSVLKESVEKYLNLEGGEVVVDATLGLGGHASIILKNIGDKGKLIAFDQDERNMEEAKERLSSYGKQIIYVRNNFRYLKSRLNENGVQKVNAILLDLGLSSPHIDDAGKGFSFQSEGPLDMRFDLENSLTAAEILNTYDEEVLMKMFFEYGEEKMSRKLAGKICERRREKPFTTTTEFAEFAEKIVTWKHLPQIFQALRISVNDELEALKEVLEQGFEVLEEGGRFVIISYHSLEDRIVKQFFRNLEKPEASEEERVYRNFGEPLVERLVKKPITPDEKELAENPRSRSAKLRAYKKL